jgi:hypothetical protein
MNQTPAVTYAGLMARSSSAVPPSTAMRSVSLNYEDVLYRCPGPGKRILRPQDGNSAEVAL